MEGELLKRAKEGDEEAWGELVRKYAPFIKLIARKYFIPDVDFEDIVQEGMIGFLKAVRSFDPSKLTGFKTFMEMCVERQIISALRRATRRKDLPLESKVSLDIELGSEGLDIDESLSKREALHGFYISLSDLERSILREYLEGKSYFEIAQAIGCSLKTVDNALQRIKRKLRKAMDLSRL
ncbi:MAG: sigma-70 family RNA polymerase sigma factor [Synergistetes bacterium]|nr:sigma-70 family RNA polymerase sigma factor [Synergistota bacterium]